ncbi:acyl-CoA dehydrogenase family protein [Parasphingopyxis marina]|uniref:Acyl-CoA dehydrogenase family protein n=1 Tax=Parasphingopyxis marina TaxID=2761622 RepID=A0A842HXT8_9SPHN|nr:acyl-CoA dehydrogenase family protein [Parasphingopyxis marina]MBC2778988.1 acyl-CoA dehydrogenase family protein [Parasphingopyxis marina]
MNAAGEAEHLVLLRDTLRRFIEKEMPRDLVGKWDKENIFPRDVHDKLAELGLTGLTVPEEFGGSGRDITATILVIEELCSRSMAVGCAYIQSSCYAGLNLSEVASDEQRAALLPRVASEGLMFAYGFTEPDVGADLASVRTSAVREGDELVINGAKRFCSGAAISEYIYALVRTGPAEEKYRNLSLVLIPPDAPGVTLTPQDTMGLKGGGTFDVSFDDVRVPVSNVIGGEEGLGQGWAKLVGPGLDIEKIEVAAMALGIARGAVDDAWNYAQERVQFGKPICTIQSVRHMLADVKTKFEACRLMTYNAAALVDAKEPAAAETAMAKLFVCDTARDIVLTCQQIMGAYGYVRDFDMERYVRDILVMPILGGSSAIQRNNIANLLKLPR